MRTVRLTVPSPALPERLDQFIAANVPGLSRKQAKRLIDAGQVRLDGRRERKAATMLRPGRQVEIDYRPSRIAPPEIPADRVIAEGPGWLAVDKPTGIPTHRSEVGGRGVPEVLGEALGVGPETLLPAHRLDRETSGVLLLARDTAAVSALSSLFEKGGVQKLYRAIVTPAPTTEVGELTGPEDMTARWNLLRRSRDGSRAELAVRPDQGRTHQVRRLLAAVDHAIVGDTEYGSPVPGGAPRMALHCERMAWQDVVVHAPPPPDWDLLLAPPPKSAAVPAKERRSPSSGLRRTLRVSGATARIVRSGHPWVIRDSQTGDLGGFSPGDLADLVDPRGQFVATAIVDPHRPVCARAVDHRADVELDDGAWAKRTRRALRRRSSLLEDPQTDAFRLVHGEADRLPGVRVDLWGATIVSMLATEASRSIARVVYETLREELGAIPVYEQDHFSDLRTGASPPAGAALPGRFVFGARGDDRWTVLERGLRYEVRPTAGLTTGLYTDQRANRERLAHVIQGLDREPRIANLFAHTGAFSVAAACAGAREVISVDLAPTYGDWTRRNLQLNGLDPALHPVVAGDAVDFLKDAPELDGVVIDPPAFARGRGKRVDWSARRDYRALVEAAGGRLAPGGFLLCAVNLKGLGRDWLRQQVEGGLEAADRRVERTEGAAPSPDHPRLKGFPEGVPFRGLLAWTNR